MSENENIKPHIKYAEATARYRATQYRSSFAIPKELEPNIERAYKAAGANSLSDLIRCLATHPEEAGELLKPVVQKASIINNPKPRKKYLATEIKELGAAIKNAGLTLEQIEAIKRQVAEAAGDAPPNQHSAY